MKKMGRSSPYFLAPVIEQDEHNFMFMNIEDTESLMFDHMRHKKFWEICLKHAIE